MSKLNIDKLVRVDASGMPFRPDIRQLYDKDIRELFERDTTIDKREYIKWCGVIYYLGDPKSPAKQQGLDDKESLKLAIENFDLPKDYVPDPLVKKLIEKYYRQNITEAGIAIEALRKSIHLISVAAVKINDLLQQQLNDPTLDREGITGLLTLMDSVGKRINDIPAMTKALNVAYENLQSEEEQMLARGGKTILSSMDADEE